MGFSSRSPVIQEHGSFATSAATQDNFRRVTDDRPYCYEGLQSVEPSRAIYFGGVYQMGDV